MNYGELFTFQRIVYFYLDFRRSKRYQSQRETSRSTVNYTKKSVHKQVVSQPVQKSVLRDPVVLVLVS